MIKRIVKSKDSSDALSFFFSLMIIVYLSLRLIIDM